MMPIRLSIVSALPDAKIIGSTVNRRASAIHGAANPANAAAAPGELAAPRAGTLAVSPAASLNVRAFP